MDAKSREDYYRHILETVKLARFYGFTVQDVVNDVVLLSTPPQAKCKVKIKDNV